MRILLSNDDGVYAPGLNQLQKTLRDFASVDVVAPDRDCSGASNSLTLDNPLRVKQLDNGFTSVEGTPTDCVHLALTGLVAETPDIVVSGINAGANLGDDVLYSGTVAAATEGRFLGYPAIAISLCGKEYRHYDTAAEVTKQIVTSLVQQPLSARNVVLNVNVPDIPLHMLQGFAITRLGTRHCAEPVVKSQDPRGRAIYWVGPPGAEADGGPGTDFHAISQGKVSISPLIIDLTHHEMMNELTEWISVVEAKQTIATRE